MSISNYIETLNYFIKLRNNPTNDVYTIRYEDLFKNNYQELKSILDSIGMEYTNDIFDNTKYKNSIGYKFNSLNKIPPNTQHERYRTYQINQEFRSFNDTSKLDLTEEQIKILTNNKELLDIYPEIINNVYIYNNESRK